MNLKAKQVLRIFLLSLALIYQSFALGIGIYMENGDTWKFSSIEKDLCIPPELDIHSAKLSDNESTVLFKTGSSAGNIVLMDIMFSSGNSLNNIRTELEVENGLFEYSNSNEYDGTPVEFYSVKEIVGLDMMKAIIQLPDSVFIYVDHTNFEEGVLFVESFMNGDFCNN